MLTILLIGNSDGIGLETTKELLNKGHYCIGVSKSETTLVAPNYKHYICDISEEKYKQFLVDLLSKEKKIDVCIYLAGVGGQIDWSDLAFETKVFQVNTYGAVLTTEVLLKHFIGNGHGVFIGISSLADSMTSSDSPSYSASKSAVTKYWEGLALGNLRKEISICNVRFGFVDTKMAKSSFKPFMLSKKQAAGIIINLITEPRIRVTKPKLLVPLVILVNILTWIRITVKSLFSKKVG